MLLYEAFRNHTAAVPRSPLRRAHFGAGRLDLKDTGFKNDQPFLKKTVSIHTSDKLFIRKESVTKPGTLTPRPLPFSFCLFVVLLFLSPFFFLVAVLSFSSQATDLTLFLNIIVLSISLFPFY